MHDFADILVVGASAEIPLVAQDGRTMARPSCVRTPGPAPRLPAGPRGSRQTRARCSLEETAMTQWAVAR